MTAGLKIRDRVKEFRRSLTAEKSSAKGVTMTAEGGSGGRPRDIADGLSPLWRAKMERRAIANGWLKGPNGLGLDEEKLGGIAQVNVALALDRTESARIRVAASRNVVAIVGQVMEQEKREAGGETVNVTVTGQVALTVEQAVQADRELEAWERERGLRGIPEGDRLAEGNPEVPA